MLNHSAYTRYIRYFIEETEVWPLTTFEITYGDALVSLRLGSVLLGTISAKAIFLRDTDALVKTVRPLLEGMAFSSETPYVIQVLLDDQMTFKITSPPFASAVNIERVLAGVVTIDIKLSYKVCETIANVSDIWPFISPTFFLAGLLAHNGCVQSFGDISSLRLRKNAHGLHLLYPMIYGDASFMIHVHYTGSTLTLSTFGGTSKNANLRMVPFHVVKTQADCVRDVFVAFLASRGVQGVLAHVDAEIESFTGFVGALNLRPDKFDFATTGKSVDFRVGLDRAVFTFLASASLTAPKRPDFNVHILKNSQAAYSCELCQKNRQPIVDIYPRTEFLQSRRQMGNVRLAIVGDSSAKLGLVASTDIIGLFVAATNKRIVGQDEKMQSYIFVRPTLLTVKDGRSVYARNDNNYYVISKRGRMLSPVTISDEEEASLLTSDVFGAIPLSTAPKRLDLSSLVRQEYLPLHEVVKTSHVDENKVDMRWLGYFTFLPWVFSGHTLFKIGLGRRIHNFSIMYLFAIARASKMDLSTINPTEAALRLNAMTLQETHDTVLKYLGVTANVVLCSNDRFQILKAKDAAQSTPFFILYITKAKDLYNVARVSKRIETPSVIGDLRWAMNDVVYADNTLREAIMKPASDW